MDQNQASPEGHAGVDAALLAYFAAPGQHQVRRRQPAILFDALPRVLQFAAGREASPVLRQAAVFFVRQALLYEGADAHAILGAPAGAVPADLKERYRLLMRLVHPDAQATGSSWPDGTAARVNRAYEVLSLPQPDIVLPDEDGEAPHHAPQRVRRRRRVHGRAGASVAPSRLRKVLPWLLVGMLGIVLLPPMSEVESLTQAPARAPAVQAAAETGPDGPSLRLALSDRLSAASQLGVARRVTAP